MFGIGSTEFLVIIVVAILVLGPEHLPRMTRTFAKVMSEFRRVSTDFQRTMNLEANKEEWREQQAAAEAKKKKKKKKTASKNGKAGTAGTAGAAGTAGTSAKAQSPAEKTGTGDAAESAATDSGPAPAGGAATEMTSGAPLADGPDGQKAAAASGGVESKA